jgi:hypothetical protein
MMVLLHEVNGAYREIYLDGRPLPGRARGPARAAMWR